MFNSLFSKVKNIWGVEAATTEVKEAPQKKSDGQKNRVSLKTKTNKTVKTVVESEVDVTKSTKQICSKVLMRR